jgi:hypothetical protein
MNRQFYTIASSLLILGITAPIAAASDYSSDTNSTQLVLAENNADGQGGGFYFTQLQGDQWTGDIKITQVQDTVGHRVYVGTFVDRSPVRRQRGECKGDIRLDRSLSDAVVPQVSMLVKWTVTGGTNCAAPVGQVFELQLTESLPKADRDGNYTPTNSTTAKSDITSNYTWRLWEVIAADGKLNCRATPEMTGKVTHTYKTGDRLEAYSRGGIAVLANADGTTWLNTPRKRCFVRASDRAVKPVSMPF